MPIPESAGFDNQTPFAADETFPAGSEDWSGLPNKLALTGYAQGIEPGETVPAPVINYELHRASQLALSMAPIDALNWTSGEDSTRAGLDTFLIIGAVYVPGERLWIASGQSGATKRLLASYNGRHWIDQSPGGFPGSLNIAATQDLAFIFAASGVFYVRLPDALSGVVDGPHSPAGLVDAYADASGTGADNIQSWMADPDVANRIWIAHRSSVNVPAWSRITGTVGGSITSFEIPTAQTAGMGAYTWAVSENVSFQYQEGRRIVCFVATDGGLVQHNVIRWSDAAPNFSTAWVGSVTNTIDLVSSVGKVVGLGRMPDDRIFALTSTGRVYLTSDLQTWVRADDVTLTDERREFYSCVQVGGITYARGAWARPSTGDFEIEGIFHSLDYGATWSFQASPLRQFGTTPPDAGRRLRGHADRLSYVGRNTAGDVSEIAWSFVTGPTLRT